MADFTYETPSGATPLRCPECAEPLREMDETIDTDGGAFCPACGRSWDFDDVDAWLAWLEDWWADLADYCDALHALAGGEIGCAAFTGLRVAWSEVA